MPPPFHLSFHEHGNSNRSFHVRQKDVGRMRVGRARREFATISFFVLLSFVAKSWTEEGGRTFVRRSLATTSLARPHCSRERHDWNPHTGLLSRNSGRVWPDRFSTSSSISRNWSNRSPDGEYHPDQPIHRFLSFLDGIQEISKHVLFSTIFAFPILPLYSLSGSNKRSYETIKLVPSVT